MTAFRPARATRLLAAAIVACALAAPARAALVHRWSFSETSGTTLADSVGGSTASIVGTGSHSLSGTQITLSGGYGANYVDLGANLLSGMSAATIELWATENAIENWGRIFDLGSSLAVTGSSADSYIQWAWNAGTAANSTQFGWMTNGVRNDHNYANVFSTGQQYAIAVTIADGAGAGGTTLVSLYVNGLLLGSFDNSAPLASFPGAVMTLGKSLWPNDSVASASYDELRISNTALTPTAIGQDATLGPGTLASPVPEPLSLATLATALAGLALARRRRA